MTQKEKGGCQVSIQRLLFVRSCSGKHKIILENPVANGCVNTGQPAKQGLPKQRDSSPISRETRNTFSDYLAHIWGTTQNVLPDCGPYFVPVTLSP